MRLVTRGIAPSAHIWLPVLAIVLALWAGPVSLGNQRWMFLVSGCSSVVVLLTLSRYLSHIFVVILGVLLLGYAVQGRGFAYLGFPPIYVGELALLLGCLALLMGNQPRQLSGLELVLIGFMVLGLIRTIPFIQSDGIDAIRDAALWYYGVFAILVSKMLTKWTLVQFVHLTAKFLPLILIWYLMMATLLRLISEALPHFPGSPVPILDVVGPGHRGVILAALVAFVASGLYGYALPQNKLSTLIFWLCWLPSAAIIAAESRGGFLAITLAALGLMGIRPSAQWVKVGIASATAFVFLILVNPTFNFGHYRDFSVDQITANFVSILSGSSLDEGSVQSTKDWRLRWWSGIYHDTVEGSLFWTGWGFGANLADEYGFLGTGESAFLRSPHNSHITVLARMGVPGLLLWIVLQLTFAWQMLKGFFRSRQSRRFFWSSLYAWLFAVWIAVMVESLFDVYLEGPHGGIIFWCLFGGGLGAIRIDFESQSDGESSPVPGMVGADFPPASRISPLMRQ